jgi:hypothetical protein
MQVCDFSDLERQRAEKHVINPIVEKAKAFQLGANFDQLGYRSDALCTKVDIIEINELT